MALSKKDRMLLFVTDVLSTATLNVSELSGRQARSGNKDEGVGGWEGAASHSGRTQKPKHGERRSSENIFFNLPNFLRQSPPNKIFISADVDRRGLGFAISRVKRQQPRSDSVAFKISLVLRVVLAELHEFGPVGLSIARALIGCPRSSCVGDVRDSAISVYDTREERERQVQHRPWIFCEDKTTRNGVTC